MTSFDIIDNSGGLKAHLIRVLRKPTWTIGDIISVSLIKVLPNKKVKKGEVHKALIVRTRRRYRRIDGTHLSFSDNGILLMTSELAPMGTRIIGPVPLELQRMKKIAALSSHFV